MEGHIFIHLGNLIMERLSAYKMIQEKTPGIKYFCGWTCTNAIARGDV